MCLSGGDLSPLELADVNGDGLRDVLLSFVTSRNASAVGKGRVFSRLLQEKLSDLTRKLLPRGHVEKGLL